MPDWIEQLLIRFFAVRGIEVNRNELAEQFVKVDFATDGYLEVNFIPEDESLLFSMRLIHRTDESLLSHALQLNHFTNQRPFSPTCHLYENDIVLRVVLPREQLEMVNVEAVFESLMNINQVVAER